MHVLDSSALIEAIEEGPLAQKVEDVLKDGALITTSICMHELLVGASTEKECFVLEGLFSKMRILEFDAKAAKISSRIENRLTKEGKKIGSVDCLIAGICIANDAVLVSFDEHFQRIPGLKIAKI